MLSVVTVDEILPYESCHDGGCFAPFPSPPGHNQPDCESLKKEASYILFTFSTLGNHSNLKKGYKKGFKLKCRDSL